MKPVPFLYFILLSIAYSSLVYAAPTLALDVDQVAACDPEPSCCCQGSEIGRTGLSLGSGTGIRKITPIRLGVQYTWYENPSWPLWSYMELSFYHLKGKKGVNPWSHDHLQGLALTPVFRFEPYGGCFYLEAGVGIARLSHNEISGRELGMHFEFEDRIGAGFRFGSQKQFDVSYRFLHFSNANIGKFNHGLNLHFLILGYWFR